jgi:hypothetical protein
VIRILVAYPTRNVSNSIKTQELLKMHIKSVVEGLYRTKLLSPTQILPNVPLESSPADSHGKAKIDPKHQLPHWGSYKPPSQLASIVTKILQKLSQDHGIIGTSTVSP